MIACVESCHEDEELREETCEGRNTSQREQAERHNKRELGIGAVKSIVIVNADESAVLLYDIHHCECPHVGCHIDKKIENHGCHALRCAAHEGEHEVTGLRDGRECHKTLEVFLTNGEEVGNGD